ncbi:murein biosynthesis integral membrane protein MurJ [Dermacoccus nishinomiyaensis]|uniref:murein biosynthesis integral membrane protein MurJ n=2 Tax=Dermacoccaceae TaxID=145357 RepID=UPI000E088A6A|nr:MULTISPECIES: murein biosynthesis integral membrane protein MurJ [Dermacoccus]MBO1759037.1 murein biosynthesis integral membrane protein MurJ [Dermacoccus sp. NHGro5]MCT1604133.1 murein biosynthesis integral membrane protein MurJ [Dermacoccus nishinomiyaensis]QQY24925.1 murein biosynthesis integral membrane protein MurJ [Dermacoccus nishinomiyaensis]TCJ90363.1 putative peptidoglycan lipid II flippase [Dermacoccus sp. SAI-028]STD18897.1 integral membrane protein MviN [Dermacoccus nishinomiya
MSNAEPDPSRPNGAASGSLGAMYETAVRHTIAMPNVAGTSIGSAYESWFEADQEAQWLRNLESTRSHASSDHTQVIDLGEVDAYRERREAEDAWNLEADDALAVSGRPGAQRGSGASRVSRETREARTAAIPTTGAAGPATDAVETPADGPQTAAAKSSGTGGVLRNSAIMAAGTLVSRMLGLLRSVLTVWALGSTTGIANTWATANSLPNIIYLLLAGGVINAVLVPQITRALEHSDGGKAYTDRIVTLTLTILLGVTVIGMALAPWVYQIYDHKNVTGDKLHVATAFTLICLPQIFFYGVYTILGQVLNARGRFGAFMWSPALANVVIILGLVWFIAAYPHGQNGVPPYSGWTTEMILVLALPATLAIVAQALVLVPVLKRAGYSFTPNFKFRGVGLRSASTMAGWAFAAVIVQQLGLIVTSRLLNSQPDGEPGKGAQDQAFLLFTLPHSLITVSLVTALFTRMSIAAGRNETDKVKDDMTTGIRLSGLASVMLTFGCFALVFPLVSAMFGADPDTRWAIGSMAIAMLVGLVPYSLCLVIQRVFYAYNDAKTPFWMQIICTGIAVGLTVPWFFLQDTTILGHPGAHWVGVGVGLAQTISNVVQAAVGFVLLRRRFGAVDLSETVRTYVRLAIAAIIATGVTLLVSFLIHQVAPVTRVESLVELLIIGPLFLAVYFLVASRLRVQEINSLLGPITRRLRRG